MWTIISLIVIQMRLKTNKVDLCMYVWNICLHFVQMYSANILEIIWLQIFTYFIKTDCVNYIKEWNCTKACRALLRVTQNGAVTRKCCSFDKQITKIGFCGDLFNHSFYKIVCYTYQTNLKNLNLRVIIGNNLC